MRHWKILGSRKAEGELVRKKGVKLPLEVGES
jgi:hypothetical protein